MQSTRSSREYAVEVPLVAYEEYSGEIIQFNADFIELKYQRRGSSKMDVVTFYLADPKLRIIYGDPSGGPGLIVVQGDAPVSYNDARDPIIGNLTPGPHGLIKVNRNGGIPVWVRGTHMNIKNEDLAPGQNTPAEQRRLFARGNLGQRVIIPGAKGKAPPPKMAKGAARPPVGSPALAKQSDDWTG
jgi:hypothetical protein